VQASADERGDKKKILIFLMNLVKKQEEIRVLRVNPRPISKYQATK
jgi:hypothetical protein